MHPDTLSTHTRHWKPWWRCATYTNLIQAGTWLGL